MQTKDTPAAAELRTYFEDGDYAHADNIALVLERLPNGELAWLKPRDQTRAR